MAELIFTFADPLVGEVLAAAETAGSKRPMPPDGVAAPMVVAGRWQDATGAALREPFPLALTPKATLEFPTPDGTFASAAAPPGLSFSAEVPAGAAALQVEVNGQPVERIPMSAFAEPRAALPAPISRRIGERDASFVMPVFAERFTDRVAFVNAVEQLHAWILDQPPFDEQGLGKTLAFDAHFWPSDPDSGLFNTLDENNPDERLFYGDRLLARRLLAPWTGSGTSLILINSRLRGGAGGQPGYSAWTSIASRGSERWEAVCLHEVGHALGLADEYLDEERRSEWPSRFEPNVSADPRPSKASWAALATVGDEPAPTAAILQSAAAGTIGTFQGARYRPDLYRPTQDCLMKETRYGFCAICRAHIAKLLG